MQTCESLGKEVKLGCRWKLLFLRVAKKRGDGANKLSATWPYFTMEIKFCCICILCMFLLLFLRDGIGSLLSTGQSGIGIRIGEGKNYVETSLQFNKNI